MGYLRWYDDLRDLPGYWPLAEAIALTIKINGRFQKELRWLTAQFAQEQGIRAETVHSHMIKDMEQAIQAHPDFASQVMGSLSDPYALSLRMFLIHSQWWLSCHHLNRMFSRPDCLVAVWNLSMAYQEKVWRSGPCLTQADQRMIHRRGQGASFAEIGEELSLSAEEAEAAYDAAVCRVCALAGVLPEEAPDPEGRHSGSPQVHRDSANHGRVKPGPLRRGGAFSR